ncbi:alpha/beta hydrolase [Yangia mangrovi]|uniref:Alpha/beta hydrolase n=2 Tax=Alloyangia mangrovi TaxID=1779329 RepID=A0ABT2KGR3_9RHOB|nr:alpha/beta hydrolase [Alloyangia mangrovi]MCT4368908.1 alpha/beta hydrolase [Alloyangia mangrovi]
MSMTAPSTTMQAVLDRLAREDAGLGDPSLLEPQHGRTLAALGNLRWNEDLPEMAEARNVIHAGMPARLVVPRNDTGREAILHVHGGGWAFCSPITHESAARRLAEACACPVLTFDYRLAPEHPYPAGLDDVVEAWSARDRSRRWSLAGDSAGANLALAAMLRLLDEGTELPATALLFYGVYGADFATPSYLSNADGPGLTRAKMMRYWDWYAAADHRTQPCVAPLAASDAQLSALPPLYLNAAALDPLLSDTEQLVARLRALGRGDRYDLFKGVVHGFMQMGNALPEAREAFVKSGEAFRQITA